MPVTNKKVRLVVASLVTLAVLAGGAWVMLKSDTLTDGKASFLTMTQAMTMAKEAANACWTEKQIAVVDCSEVKARMPKSPSAAVDYLVSDQGALIGVDYAAHVVVVLTPQASVGAALTWRCSGVPADALARSCTPSR